MQQIGDDHRYLDSLPFQKWHLFLPSVPLTFKSGWSLWPLGTADYGGSNPWPVSGPRALYDWQLPVPKSQNPCSWPSPEKSDYLAGETTGRGSEAMWKRGTWRNPAFQLAPIKAHMEEAVLDGQNHLPAESHGMSPVVPASTLWSGHAQVGSAGVPVPLNSEIQWNICCFESIWGVICSALKKQSSLPYSLLIELCKTWCHQLS